MFPLSRKRYRISRILSRYSGENWASESSNPLGFNTRLWILRTSCKVRVCPGMISDSGVAEVIACVMGSISRCDGRPQKESAHTHTHTHTKPVITHSTHRKGKCQDFELWPFSPSIKEVVLSITPDIKLTIFHTPWLLPRLSALLLCKTHELHWHWPGKEKKQNKNHDSEASVTRG